jgi:tetratricopeptide (TPR) repeat protein
VRPTHGPRWRSCERCRRELGKNAWGGAERVYGWSFYSQGTQEQTPASADVFIDRALRWLGDPDPTRGSPRDRGLRLAERVRQQKTLLVIDGVEPLQHPPGPQAGKIRDPALAALVKELARQNPGLCVVTTREALADVAHLEDATAPRMSLEELSAEDGAALLEMLGVHGKKSELRAAAKEFGGHALALNLLGTYLERAHGGDVRRRGEVPLLTADAKLGGHAFRVMEAYVRWFAAREEGAGPELAVLRLLGLFDRPAEAAALAALRRLPVIKGLNDGLMKGRRWWRREPIGDDEWNFALSNLEECRLVKLAEGELDAHPLVREWFGGQLEKRDKTAFQAGHRRLYEHSKASKPELPETLEEMQPLYAAVVHGCRAGEHDEAFNQVYWPRISRGNEQYQIHKLGAFGADLAALAGFFERTWSRPVAGLREGDRAWLLNAAGFCLRALGRLPEAVGPMEAGLERDIAQQDWKNAAVSAGNLSELSLTLGEVARAVAHGEESVRLADRSGDAFQRMVSRTILADALHQAGRWEESRGAFREAEALQAERQPHYPRLYSLQGHRYCDLLLAFAEPEDGAGLDGVAGSEAYRRACEAVAERAAQALKWGEEGGWYSLLAIALDHLSLGRAHLGLALAAAGREAAAEGGADPFATAAEHLDQAVEGLRGSGTEHNLPWGLLARAAFRRRTADLPGAAADLDEAQEIAERGSMRLHLCDAHLERARLHRDRGEPETAREHLDAAARLVEETGYERRRREVEQLRGRLG